MGDYTKMRYTSNACRVTKRKPCAMFVHVIGTDAPPHLPQHGVGEAALQQAVQRAAGARGTEKPNQRTLPAHTQRSAGYDAVATVLAAAQR